MGTNLQSRDYTLDEDQMALVVKKLYQIYEDIDACLRVRVTQRIRAPAFQLGRGVAPAEVALRELAAGAVRVARAIGQEPPRAAELATIARERLEVVA